MARPVVLKRPGASLAERFWSRVEKSDAGSCWQWKGFVQSNGYGKFTVGSEKCWLAHRLAWFLTYGTEPAELDHLCRNRACVNPAHLEAVTHGENNRRKPHVPRPINVKSHCRHGHEYTPENTYWRPDHRLRQCRACAIDARARRQARANAVTPSSPRAPEQYSS